MKINNYQDFAIMTENSRWNVEKDIDWTAIDKELALSQPELLAQLRDSALIESYHPMSTLSTIQMVWDDVDACSILQVEQFEGFRHFWVLRRYLDIVGYEPAITDEELVGHRERNLENVRCRVPCDYIPKRSYPLFRTRQILNDWLTQNLEEA